MSESMVMTKTIKDAFDKMCIERLDDIRREDYMPEEYKEHLNRSSEILQELLSLVPEDKRQLVFELEEVYTAISALDEYHIYKIGLNDGKKLLHLF